MQSKPAQLLFNRQVSEP